MYFYGLILVEICSFLFHITQIQCLGDHKIVEKYMQRACTMEHVFYNISVGVPLTAVQFKQPMILQYFGMLQYHWSI